MRIAVFSDVHSNHTALEACFRTAEARGADLWVFLGDYVSDCANPRATMELLYRARREHDCVFIKGNREEYILGHHKNGSDWQYGMSTGSLLYTYRNLTAEDLAFLDTLPNVRVINPNGKSEICLCHGSPEKTRETLHPFSYNVERWLLKIEQPLLMSGHTHRPLVARNGEKTYVNPGAVGIQATETVTAKMAFLESDGRGWQPELVEVPYDVAAAVAELEQCGLPELAGVWGRAIAKQLREGKNYSLFCVERAAELAAGSPVLLEHWAQAARDFGID
ncbi:MAG TPA: metallophosphatase family protein [Candidatus Ruminococcus gallistercoris]|nr:metallophosphatase family protein [Candidatus Ruminococcus gallistercoris]